MQYNHVALQIVVSGPDAEPITWEKTALFEATEVKATVLAEVEREMVQLIEEMGYWGWQVMP